jgi:flagellar biosynthetic protein FlhB
MAERTEAPTPRRREEARRRGQVAKSFEINSALILLVGFWMLSSTGPRSMQALATTMQRSFTVLSSADMTVGTLRAGGLALAGLMAQAVAPLVLTLMVVGVVANLAQVGFMFSQEALRPDFSRVNPLTGLRRIFSGRGLVELIKSLLKLAVIGLVVYTTLRDNFDTIAASSRMSLSGAVSSLAGVAAAVGLRAAVVMLVIAAADYVFQRREFEKSLRMTRQELVEEMKRNENIQLKSRIRARQRQLAMSRMMSAVPQADVVITNPTHLAIAVRYDRAQMTAPQVVAKGQRLIAERIRQEARAHKVPVVENKPLARALFKSVEVGHEIPVDLYQAVAEVLAFVYRLKTYKEGLYGKL